MEAVIAGRSAAGPADVGHAAPTGSVEAGQCLGRPVLIVGRPDEEQHAIAVRVHGELVALPRIEIEEALYLIGARAHDKLLRVVAIEAQSEEDAGARLALLAEARGIAELSLHDAARAFGYAAQGLRVAVAAVAAEAGEWVGQARRLSELTGDAKALVALLREVVETVADAALRVDITVLVAEVARDRLGDRALARATYEHALELRADEPRALVALEVLYEEDGDRVELLPIHERRAENATDEPARKALLEPAYESGDLNGLELQVAGYLDAKQAVRWWHRNVARTQYGLQGWKRHKVYPDFVFGLVGGLDGDGTAQRLVLLETKGAHLGGSEDTAYEEKLLVQLAEAFKDQRWQQVGGLELVDGQQVSVGCDLLLSPNWQGALEARWFANGVASV